ncbi:hypothetical protein PINS_up015375 [Pythium insidiosum]|nr:hypothetical protein PINS_up015375 [Pythium insidiosum]
MMAMPTTKHSDELASMPPADAAGASDRAYGTFEVSVVDVESDSETVITNKTKKKKATNSSMDADEQPSACGLCSDDCCVLMSAVWAPFRLHTYKIVLFHFVNALFAVGAALWTLGFHTAKFFSPASTRLRRLEAASLRSLLQWDSMLFNFISPPSECVVVYSSSTSFRDENGVYGFQAQVYFGLTKLLCSAIPGVVSALVFLSSLQHFVELLAYGPTGLAHTSSSSAPMAPEDADMIVLLTILALYAAAVLTTVVGTISRQVTMYFCADYLLYSSL